TESIPVIVVSAYHDSGLLERAQKDHILAYLVKPIKRADLETAIAIAVRRFEQFQDLRGEADSLRQALEDQKAIEQAKMILMKTAHIDESEAFLQLRRLARAQNRKLVEVAQIIVLENEAS